MSWVLLFIGLLLAPAASANLPALPLSHAVQQQPLAGVMSVVVLPVTQPADPESYWHANPIDTSAWPAQRWLLRPGQRVVGRMLLQSLRERDVYVIQVPVAAVDHVQVWWREPGKPWHAAEAGDRVPLSRWPFYGQFPAFPLAMSEEPLELIVTAANDAPMSLPIVVKTDAAYREGRLMQANLTGLAMGLGAMGAVVCLIAAATYRRRASWVVLGFASWAFVHVACASGYMAIWLTPEWPAFNDASKAVAAAVLSGLLVAVMAEVLDHLDGWAWLRWLGPVAVASSLLFAAVDLLWLPPAWRPAAVLGWEAACIALALALCVLSHLRGTRHIGFRVLAVAAFALAVGLEFADFGLARGVEWVSLASALLLFASAQLLRHGQFLRERYGRDVLGRAAISAHRDPLTAVLSYSGLQQAYEEATLRQAAGRGPVSVLMFALPGYDDAGVDHGHLLTERALVRFAAALQQVLGHPWAIGRLSKTRFGAVTSASADADAVQQMATRVLAHCSRLKDPLSPVTDFDLRIVCAHRTDGLLPFKELLRLLEDASQNLPEGKRIAVAHSTPEPAAPDSVPKGATVE